jgi:isoleucyl-tRNA synthetase
MDARLAAPDALAAPDIAVIEALVARRWQASAVQARSLEQAEGAPPWICYAQPPAASGMPGIDQVRAGTVRDLYQRLRAMQGFLVPRHGGCYCHGLAVEVAVESELGLSSARDIEALGVRRFTARCQESALRHLQAHTELMIRIGAWDPGSAVGSTMDPAHVDEVWSSLTAFYDAGLLTREDKVTWYCPRCQTPLADYEADLRAARRKVTGHAVTVRFRLRDLPAGVSSLLTGADLLASTTEPWTLPATSAIAVHPHQVYAVARRAGHDDRVVVAEAAFARVLGDGWHVAGRVSGAELTGSRYAPAFGSAASTARDRDLLIPGYFVTPEVGTGLVPVAPAFGADDLAAGQEHGLPAPRPIGPDGCFHRDQAVAGGVFFKDASRILISALADRGLLFSSRERVRGYPHCWRCGTPLLAWTLPAWFLRTAAASDQPRPRKERDARVRGSGRRGRAARGPDRRSQWGLSRTRYWGTPIPIWECAGGHHTCVSSRAELARLARADLSALDPHEPQVDRVVIACPRCGRDARRVPEVLDGSYDRAVLPLRAGRRPAAATGTPEAASAQLVIAGPDQGAWWLDALQVISEHVTGGRAYDSALCLGAVTDEGGRAMTSGAGNKAEPLALTERYGADALRWLCAVACRPQDAMRVSEQALRQVVSKVLLKYLGTAAFYLGWQQDARASGEWWRHDGHAAPPVPDRPLLDRWILSELHSLTGEVTTALESWRTDTAGRQVRSFLGSLSNWYLRRTRHRFAAGATTRDGAAAFATLHECLDVLTRLMAPIAPFATDFVWAAIRDGAMPDSVHLAGWPVPLVPLIDDQLSAQMAQVREIARLGRAVRARAGIPLRQPLARAVITLEQASAPGDELSEIVAAELNVASIGPWPDSDSAVGGPAPQGWTAARSGRHAVAVNTTVTPELRSAGLARAAIRAIQAARKADGLHLSDRIAVRWSASDADLARAMHEHGSMICSAVRAGDYEAAATARIGLDGREHVSAGLGLTCWISRLR